ncbi:DUF2071 domain-containing protein [Frankia sp. CNm7]|uniref:DUF2071 domain-containing protein n=1 Tax=Frankia nepalensis TaxID=1836974 RepID=A0A937UPZ8_9ACTN|nr:DUF2071 domain-containing protein [Frankia nepalensis]MBL7498856.1 DUF2071 domain-containing protein [Frankia nepalensis]MBL7513688.1 DUF2071 domain-containing protein [Frankia nepalensis]MBL7524153.1 DUF2071 domain-containing protein [Frankia nepalensis]MBL7631364.1 DUF2071 domain-containing protein [Frankia nepalensis]
MAVDDLADRVAPGQCPFTVERPVMRQRWERLAFLHWRYEPDVVRVLLPPGLEVDTHHGQAWVSLVPFLMRVSTGRHGRRVPGGVFPETNVRTYVRDAAGRPGIWFFSLDAARLGAVVVARTTYRLPYFWSAMHVDQRDDTLTYTCRRRWPDPRPAASRVVVRAGELISHGDLDARDHFLTARFRLFSPVRSGPPRTARAWHEPWPLWSAELLELDDTLVTAAGLPAPEGDPLVHWSQGVDVRISRPET